jgi:hypothetical protein
VELSGDRLCKLTFILANRPKKNLVEIPIEDLENILRIEVSRYRSKGVISISTDATAKYDPESNSLVKKGENLRVGDVILRAVDKEGYVSEAENNKWRVVELIYSELLDVDELQVGRVYSVYSKAEQAVLPFSLTEVDLETKGFHFKSMVEGGQDIDANVRDLPSVYPAGTDSRVIHKIVLEHVEKNSRERYSRAELLIETVKDREFKLYVGETHVVEAVGDLSLTPPMNFTSSPLDCNLSGASTRKNVFLVAIV